jgi:hypothetical protein
MSLETNKYDIIYGRLLHLNFTPTHAKGLAKVLYDVTEQYGFSVNHVLQYVDGSGVRFDNEIYTALNNARTNSSQIGYIDREYIPPAILQQVA